MKLIESKVEYIPQEPGIEGVYKQIEFAGRTCYKSENRITEDSAKTFVDNLKKSGHTAMLEHGTVYLYLKSVGVDKLIGLSDNPYSKVKVVKSDTETGYKGQPVYHIYATTNMRVLHELDMMFYTQYIKEPTSDYEKRYTFRFTCDRGISHELCRHRKLSFAMESQRYCNYSKDKFGGEITFIIPQYLLELKEGRYINYNGDWYSDIEYVDPTDIIMKDSETHNKWNSMLHCFSMAEQEYQYLLKGATPQEARAILPNATKTELVITGFASDWRFLLDLRLFEKTGKVHPDMKVLMQKFQKAAEEAGIWKDIMSYPSKFK